jgi:phosphatidate phosphatase APP1
MSNNLFLAEEEGFSIISDIDDTIRVSEVLSKLSLIMNTFLLPFKDVEGMPMFFRDLQRDLTVQTSRGYISKPTFHYLSGTPYQFLGAIQPFLERIYPLGEIISQTFSIDSGGFASFTDVKPYKIRGATKIINFFNQRKFIMIGDSTQFDPEVYANMALVNPESVVCIFIRIVTGVNIKRELVQNSNTRFQYAFSDLPKEKWSLFKDPSDLPSTRQIAKGICRKDL